MTENDNNTNIDNEDDVDSCGCKIDEVEATPDEDLPTSVGGVD